jgi:hypothetical protein
MAEAISLVSVVLGISEVSFRLAKEVVDTISKLKNVSAGIRRVRDEIEELINILQQIHHLCQIYSQSSLDDSSTGSFKIINQVLASCKEDLLKLRKRLTKLDPKPDSVFGRAARSVKFVPNKREISETCQHLERHKTSLLACLSTIGR